MEEMAGRSRAYKRNRRLVIGKVDTLSPEEARLRCQKILGNVAHGQHPLHGIQATGGMTLGMFIAGTYTTWVNASRPRTASNTLDRRGKVRFLDQSKEARLRKAMKARDEELQTLRTTGNARRQLRHEKLLPLLPHIGDHLTPAVLLSMNTGLRRGEVLKLRWRSIDFHRRLLTVEGPNAKNRQTRHVPLNEEAVNTLRQWRQQSGTGARVFDVATGSRAPGESCSSVPGSPTFAGTICAITSLPISSSTGFR